MGLLTLFSVHTNPSRLRLVELNGQGSDRRPNAVLGELAAVVRGNVRSDGVSPTNPSGVLAINKVVEVAA